MTDAAGVRRARIAVVGAGAAARELHHAGHEVVVVEKSRALGGRLADRRVGELRGNHGAPALAALPGLELERPHATRAQVVNCVDAVAGEDPAAVHASGLRAGRRLAETPAA